MKEAEARHWANLIGGEARHAFMDGWIVETEVGIRLDSQLECRIYWLGMQHGRGYGVL